MGAQTVLPFPLTPGQIVTPREKLLPQLAPELQTVCKNSEFLLDYLEYLPIERYGIPQYYEKPPRSLGSQGIRNIIYPTKENLFVHILPDEVGARDHYVPIEPTTVINVDELISKVDKRLVAFAEELGRTVEKEAKRKLLLELVDRFCAVPTENDPNAGSRTEMRKPKTDVIPVTPQQLAAIRYIVIREKLGLGILQPLLLDNNIEDISCSGVGAIFVEHKIFKSVQSSIVFQSYDDVD